MDIFLQLVTTVSLVTIAAAAVFGRPNSQRRDICWKKSFTVISRPVLHHQAMAQTTLFSSVRTADGC